MDNKYRRNRRIFRSCIVSAIMAVKIQLIFLLAIAACMVHGVPLTINQYNVMDDSEIRANIDKTVDALLPSIRKFIINNGMDPMQLIDLSENIFPDLPGILKGNVDLKKGWMQNLSLVKRTQHVTAVYKDKRLTLDMNLGFDVVDCDYQYHLTHLLYTRQGNVNARLHKLDINTVLTIDLNEYVLSLDTLKFSDVREYEIKLEGHLVDPFLNILTKIVTESFRYFVLKFIEERATFIFAAKIDEWNTKIPRPNRTDIIEKWLDIAKILPL